MFCSKYCLCVCQEAVQVSCLVLNSLCLQGAAPAALQLFNCPPRKQLHEVIRMDRCWKMKCRRVEGNDSKKTIIWQPPHNMTITDNLRHIITQLVAFDVTSSFVLMVLVCMSS